MPSSSAIGIVTPSACGSSVSSTRTTIVQSTPLAISCFALLQDRRHLSTKVRTDQRRAANGSTISRTR